MPILILPPDGPSLMVFSSTVSINMLGILSSPHCACRKSKVSSPLGKALHLPRPIKYSYHSNQSKCFISTKHRSTFLTFTTYTLVFQTGSQKPEHTAGYAKACAQIQRFVKHILLHFPFPSRLPARATEASPSYTIEHILCSTVPQRRVNTWHVRHCVAFCTTLAIGNRRPERWPTAVH
jgi:hypothetical protein